MECHTFACLILTSSFQARELEPGTHCQLFNWWFVFSLAIDPQLINSNSQRLCIVPHSCYNAKPSRRYHLLRVNHYASVKFDQVHREQNNGAFVQINQHRRHPEPRCAGVSSDLANNIIFTNMFKQLHTRPQWQRASNGAGRNNSIFAIRRVYRDDPIQHLTESQTGTIS